MKLKWNCGALKDLPIRGVWLLIGAVTLLPIAERELRLAARKRSTFWVRIISALVAFVIGTCFLLLTMQASLGSASLGKGLFVTLTWLTLAGVLCTGLFFTSDCLSEEKREGTLGFLFLTDLRGYDVVFGKLLATSLRAFYGLLALLPIVGITLLMGGVTGLQFWKTSLALVNGLFVSLVAGIFVSAISRQSQKSMAGTLLLLLLWVAAGPGIDAAVAALPGRAFKPLLSLSSPGYLFTTAATWGGSSFWDALLVNQGLAWLLLGLTCLLLPRLWQESGNRTTTGTETWNYRWRFGGTRRRQKLRRKLLELNPTLWLGCRERWQAIALWCLGLLLLAISGAAYALTRYPGLWASWGFLGGTTSLVIYLGIASQAGRFFVETRRNGFMELLLVTPVTLAEVVQGQWRAFMRMFALPLLVCVAAQCLGGFIAQQRTWKSLAAATAATTTPATVAGTNTTGGMVITSSVSVNGSKTTTTVSSAGFRAPGMLAAVGTSLASAIVTVGNLLALVWFGMWMGLNSRSTNMATLKTLLFVQVIPWFAISFASLFLTQLVLLPKLLSGNTGAASQIMIWFPMIISGVSGVLFLVKDVVFVLWARRQLYSGRGRLAVLPLSHSLATVAPPPLPALPVISGPNFPP